MKQRIDSLVIGGIPGQLPHLPGMRLQELLGTRIQIDMANNELYVPTKNGVKIAAKGDRIVLFDDDSLDVDYQPYAKS